MRGRQEADTAPREPREDHTTAAHPNTVAHSSGAACCPDEASARRHRDRATWWQHGELWRIDWGTPGYPRTWIGYDKPHRGWTW